MRVSKNETKIRKESYTLHGSTDIEIFCNDIIDSFEENGVVCDIDWNPIGCGEIILFDIDSEPVNVGTIFIQHEKDSDRKYLFVKNKLTGETIKVDSFTEEDLPNGSAVFKAFDPADVEELIGKE